MFSFAMIQVLLPLLLSPVITAQSYNTPIPCCSVSANTVPQSQRSDWCSANLNTCVDLCGGQGQVTSNTCDTNSLQYACKCSNGTSIGTDTMAQYQQTVPGQMCQFWYSACISAAAADASQQFQCTQARNDKCGNLTTNKAATSSAVSLVSSRIASASASVLATRSASLSSLSISSSSLSVSSSTSPDSGSSSAGTTSNKSGTSAGTIAGAVVGGLAGLAIIIALIWFCVIRRRRKRRAMAQATLTRNGAYDEKQVRDPADGSLLMKPELHGVSAVRELDAQSATTRHVPAELYASHARWPNGPHAHGSQDEDTRQAYITDWSAPHEMQTNAPPYTLAPTQASPYQSESQSQQHQHAMEPLSQPEPLQQPQELHPRSPAPEPAVLQRQLSAEEITSLEEEKRRIDAEMEEVRRMKELRDQKAAIQQRLRDAKR